MIVIYAGERVDWTRNYHLNYFALTHRKWTAKKQTDIRQRGG
jgi:hypothetical protein